MFLLFVFFWFLLLSFRLRYVIQFLVHRLSTLTTVTGLIWMSLSAALTERAAAVVSTPG